jgi:membrane protein YqaA with SNARE-associated domain
MIVRILAVIVIVGGLLGGLAGYGVVRWLDARRRREEWRRDTEWLAPPDDREHLP